jgi:hypothetical protein
MSLYNLLHGVNPLSPILLAILRIDQKVDNMPKSEKLETFVKECIDRKIFVSGRFRDIYLNEDGTKIILYTRNGGGNREGYWYVFKILKAHPNYLIDYEDDFDSTYAYIEFSVPKEAEKLCKLLATGEKPKTVGEKFVETMSAMEKMSKEDIEKDERFKPIIEILEKIAN